MADVPGVLLLSPLAYVQSPSYSRDDQDQGGSIEDAPDLVPPTEPGYTPPLPGPDASCLERYQYNLGACYAGALADVNEERRLLINACYADHQGAIDAALAAVANAEAEVVAWQKGLYQPADPLVLTLPVAECLADSYEIDDAVLIDFPVRVPGATGMGVWNSARVIGWADNTRQCRADIFLYYHDTAVSPNGYLLNCRGEIIPEFLPIYGGYWAGQVGGYDRFLPWLYTNQPLCAAIKRTTIIRDGAPLEIEVMLTVKRNYPGYPQDSVQIFAQDMSRPLGYGEQPTLIAYVLAPEGGYGPEGGPYGPGMTWWPDGADDFMDPEDTYRPTTLEQFYAFSVTANKLAVVSLEQTMPLNHWEGAPGMTAEVTLPEINLTPGTPVALQFAVVVKGDPQLPWSDWQMAAANGFYDHPLMRKLVLGARWDGDELQPFVLNFIRNREGFNNISREEIAENHDLVSQHFSLTSNFVWETTVGPDVIVNQYYHEFENVFEEIVISDDEIQTIAVSNHEITREQTLMAGIIPVRDFAFPIIYYSKSGSTYSETNVPSAIEYPYPSLWFLSGDQLLCEFDLAFIKDGLPTDMDIISFYTVTERHRFYLYNTFYINQRHVVIPCPVIQLDIDMPIGADRAFYDSRWSINHDDLDSTALNDDRFPLNGPNKARLFADGTPVDIGDFSEMLYLCNDMVPRHM